MNAVYDLLQETSVQDLTVESIAKRAGVGKPTIYKWWNTKSALVLAMFQERVIPQLKVPAPKCVEDAIRDKVRRLIGAFNGFFGKVIAEIIAEGQSNPDLLRELNEKYIKPRRAETVREIQDAQRDGLFPKDADPELIVDAIFGSLYYHLLLKLHPLTQEYGQALVDQVLKQAGIPAEAPPAKSRSQTGKRRRPDL
jgi:AcrR family transcriptional regulator